MPRTVIFAVNSRIGNCHVEIEDDSLTEEEAIKEALNRIEDNGVDEPSRGLRFYYNDSAEENTYELWSVEDE